MSVPGPGVLPGPGGGSSLPGHVVVVDLGFGDAGKGTVVDVLARRGAVGVVRFNGGGQAAHNVLTPGGLHHTFAQLGSASFLPGVRTHLSRFSVVEPFSLAAEADHLASLGVRDALARLTIDRSALVTTPYHRLANQERERRRGAARHGSCGMGVGETVAHSLAFPADALRAGDLTSPGTLLWKLGAVRDALQAELGPLDGPSPADVVDALLALGDVVSLVDDSFLSSLLASGPVVFEGAQGVLLDEWRGFHPHTTWSTTTFENAETLLGECGEGAFRLGVLRTYTTRHGAGPLVSEDPSLVPLLPEPHNGLGEWQGAFRRGHLDLLAHRYALEACGGVDGLALTHLDRTDPGMGVCVGYDTPSGPLDRIPLGPSRDLVFQEGLTRLLFASSPVVRPRLGSWVEEVQGGLGAPVVVSSWGPSALEKSVRLSAPALV